MKAIFERAKLLIIMLIFPKSVKFLEAQTLRHFCRASNIFSKLSLAEASKWREKETPRQTYFFGFTVYTGNVSLIAKIKAFSYFALGLYWIGARTGSHLWCGASSRLYFFPKRGRRPNMLAGLFLYVTQPSCSGVYYPKELISYFIF